MRLHTFGLFLYSSLAIVILTLVWAYRQVPRLGELAEEETRVSLEQELTVIRGAVRAGIDTVKLRTLDAVRGDAEANQRSIAESPLAAAALLETEQAQWKVTSLATKRKEFTADTFKQWVAAWPVDRLAAEQAYFLKIGEYDGRAYFGVALRVRHGAAGSALAIGVLPAAEFPLSLATDRARDVAVFDSSGVALSLNHSAYVGANLRRQPLVSEMLESDVMNVRSEWANDRGVPMIGVATRIADSNLYAAIEARTPVSHAAAKQAYIYLAIAGLGAILLNWALFAGQISPLLRQLENAEGQVETLRRLMSEKPRVAAEPLTDAPLDASKLPQLNFVENAAAPPKTKALEAGPTSTPLVKIVDQALRAVESRLKDLGVTVDRVGLGHVSVTRDVLQLQTALEEVLKNAVEALSGVDARRLTIAAEDVDGRITLTVEDSGPGADPANLPRLFEPFFTTRAAASGVSRGLGLNVVRRVIEELGGSVVARNLPDRRGFVAELAWPRDPRPRLTPTRATQKPAPIPRQPLVGELAEHYSVAAQREQAPGVRRPRVRTLE